MDIGVIISTYNNTRWLEKVLWGYVAQTCPASEIIIADDGSDHRTKELIDSFRDKLPIRHVWQEDDGFQKSRILNKALLASESEYLIFTDQDCIPRRDFVEIHSRYARRGSFLSGGYLKLPMQLSVDITFEDILSGRMFEYEWLRNNGFPLTFKSLKLAGNPLVTGFMNAVTTTKPTWNGCNSSGWREDMIRINGYNENMQYGGQDREFGERLVNLGIKPIQVRYSAITLHLDHKRPYKTKESIEKNVNIRRNTRRNGIIETPCGIKENHLV